MLEGLQQNGNDRGKSKHDRCIKVIVVIYVKMQIESEKERRQEWGNKWLKKIYYRKLFTLIESLGMKDGNMKAKCLGKYIKIIYSPIKLFQMYLTGKQSF